MAIFLYSLEFWLPTTKKEKTKQTTTASKKKSVKKLIHICIFWMTFDFLLDIYIYCPFRKDPNPNDPECKSKPGQKLIFFSFSFTCLFSC